MSFFELESVSKTFLDTGVKACNNISFSLEKGQILAITGDNGAGKTTLMRIITGLQKPDSGTMYLNNKKIDLRNSFNASSHGLGMVHQHGSLASALTVSENIALGHESTILGFILNKKRMLLNALMACERFNFSVNLEALVSSLSVAERAEAEIVKVVAQDPHLIILDEPTQVLSYDEAIKIYKVMRSLADAGKTIILVTHKLYEVKDFVDRVIEIKKGALRELNQAELETKFLRKNSLFCTDLVEEKTHTKNEIIKIENVSTKSKTESSIALNNVSFSILEGETLSISAAPGNGLKTLEDVLTGFSKAEKGTIYYKNSKVTNTSLEKLRKNGFAYIPQNRIERGLDLFKSVYENFYALQPFPRFGKKKKQYQIALEKKLKDFSLTLNVLDNVSYLSGGMMQKLIILREMDVVKNFLLCCDLNRGLDRESAEYAKKIIKKAQENKIAILYLCSDLDEAFEISDKVMVLNRGKISQIFHSNSDVERIAALHAYSGGNVEC